MIFYAKNQFTLQWTLTDQNGNPINNASVIANLYSGRSTVNPDVTPGTIVPPISNVTLNYVSSSNGVYQATIPVTLDPIPSVNGFVLTIDASISGNPIYHYEEPSTVINGSLTTSSADLMTLNQVKAWLKIQPSQTANDAILQLLISSFSQWVLHRTGRDTFNSVNSYTETQDGHGGTRLFLRNSPIQTVSNVIVGAYSIPQSTSVTANGWFIEDSLKSIALRITPNTYMTMVPSGLYPYCFERGQGNVQVMYTAGYTIVPFDLQEAAMEAIAINYSRKDWIDIAQLTLGAGQGVTGSTVYHKWALPPSINMVLDRYARRAIV